MTQGIRTEAVVGGWFRALAVLVVAASLAPGAAQDEAPGAQERQPQPAPAAQPAARYRFLEDRDALLSSWRGSGLAERLQLGVSAGGRELFGVQFGGAGPRPLAERTTVLLLGGLDGVSLSGSEAVLAVTDALLASPERLPPEVTFVSIPWANPDGLARWIESGCGDGRNDRPTDDDEDGATDEDPPDDVDADGAVLQMLVEDPAGPWVRASDPRFLRPAREGEAPRYLRVFEGRDDDRDGAYNEDPFGGVVLDLSFPLGWQGEWSGRPSGPWPLSEPEARALAELALARRTALVLLFQGNHGLLAMPGGTASGDGGLGLPLSGDLPTYRQVVERFRRATSRKQAGPIGLWQAREAERPGAAIDWFYAALGALSMEIAVWGPQVESEVQETVDAQFVRGAEEGAEPDAAEPARPDEAPSAEDRAWARWLDDTRGGLGFVEWHPVDLGDGREGLVGGWQPYTCFNPPPEVLALTLRGMADFTLGLAKALPSLEIVVLDQSREGRVGLLRVRVENRGGLPSGAGPLGAGHEATLSLELPQGVRLIAGEPRIRLGHLPGKGSTDELSWLVVAAPGTQLKIVLESRWSPPVVREVRL